MRPSLFATYHSTTTPFQRGDDTWVAHWTEAACKCGLDIRQHPTSNERGCASVGEAERSWAGGSHTADGASADGSSVRDTCMVCIAVGHREVFSSASCHSLAVAWLLENGKELISEPGPAEYHGYEEGGRRMPFWVMLHIGEPCIVVCIKIPRTKNTQKKKKIQEECET